MSSSIDSLKEALKEFDGRAVSILSELAIQFHNDESYLDHLLALAKDHEDHLSSGATWLLKTHLEDGGKIELSQTQKLINTLDSINDWQAQLHICQSIRLLSPDDGATQSAMRSLMPLLAHRKPFLRAWSLDAICHLATLFPDHQEMAAEALNIASNDPAASVRARARNLSS